MTKQPGVALRGSCIVLTCALYASVGGAGTPPAHSFKAYLVEGYGEVAAAAAQNAGNNERTSFFRERQVRAERGEAIAPVDVEGRALDPYARREADFARG